MNIDINQYQQLLKISKELLTQADVDPVLKISIDRLIEISGAERGVIILFDEAGDSLFQTDRQLEQKDIEQPEFEISRTIIEQVRSSEQPLYLPNAMEHSSMKTGNSMGEFERYNLQQVLHEFNGAIAKAVQSGDMCNKNFHQKLNKHDTCINITNSKSLVPNSK